MTTKQKQGLWFMFAAFLMGFVAGMAVYANLESAWGGLLVVLGGCMLIASHLVVAMVGNFIGEQKK